MHVLNKIAETYVDTGQDSPALDSAIQKLRAGISKEQKSLLLKIMDEYLDRVDYAAYRNFKHGFRMGVHLGRELFSNNKKYRLTRRFSQEAAGVPAEKTHIQAQAGESLPQPYGAAPGKTAG